MQGTFYVRPVKSPGLLHTSKQVLEICGLIQLTVRMRKFRARAPLLLVQNVVVDCLLGTSFLRSSCKSYIPWILDISVFAPSVCCDLRSTLPSQVGSVSLSYIVNVVPKSPNNAGIHHFFSVAGNRADGLSNRSFLLRSEHSKYRRETWHSDDERDHENTPTQTPSCSYVYFLSVSGHLSKSAVIAHNLEVLKRLPTISVCKRHPTRCKKRGSHCQNSRRL